MIRSFADAETASIWAGRRSRKHPFEIQAAALRKLRLLHQATGGGPARPDNRLEALKGKLEGQYSLRVNDQWRICFVWANGGADHVGIVDYH